MEDFDDSKTEAEFDYKVACGLYEDACKTLGEAEDAFHLAEQRVRFALYAKLHAWKVRRAT